MIMAGYSSRIPVIIIRLVPYHGGIIPLNKIGQLPSTQLRLVLADEQKSWLTTSGAVLMDLDQSNPNVSKTILDWVPEYVKTFGIDGFRIDASKHMSAEFQHTFCEAAGIFCIGEVYGDDTE
jgi:glycosidase